MEYRTLITEDLSKIIELEKSLRDDEPGVYSDFDEENLRKNFSLVGTSRNNETIVCLEEEKIVGRVDMILMHSHFDFGFVGYVDWIFVKKDYRGKGIAKELFKYAEEWFKRRNCEFYYLFVAGNDEAQAFYKSLGIEIKSIERAIKYLK